MIVLLLPVPGLTATIAVLGDSLSAAHGIAQNQGWVALLGKRLQSQCPACRLINASISGETTAGGRTRIAALLNQHHPDILIVELGGNDGLRGLPITEMYDNLEHIITSALARGTKVVLVGMRLPPNYGPHYTREFHHVYQRLVDKYHTAWVPFLLAGFADQSDLFQADGIHPIAAAQGAMLDNVWPALKPLLPSPGNAAATPP